MENIGAEDLEDGNLKLVLGLTWGSSSSTSSVAMRTIITTAVGRSTARKAVAAVVGRGAAAAAAEAAEAADAAAAPLPTCSRG